MNTITADYCFCTLSLGKKYRLLTQQLASDLQKYAPQQSLLILTDKPSDFAAFSNVIAIKHSQRGILHCYNDKSLVMKMALAKFNAAVYIDADTTILSAIPQDIKWQPGITAGHYEHLMEHISKYTPERLQHIRNVAAKLDVDIETSKYIGESLFIIARDGGKEIEYLNYWEKIARYLELRGIHAGEGNIMGLAAGKVGWNVGENGWQQIKQATQHLDASSNNKQSLWEFWKKRLGYHYRLNRTRLIALKEFDFFYR